MRWGLLGLDKGTAHWLQGFRQKNRACTCLYKPLFIYNEAILLGARRFESKNLLVQGCTSRLKSEKLLALSVARRFEGKNLLVQGCTSRLKSKKLLALSGASGLKSEKLPALSGASSLESEKLLVQGCTSGLKSEKLLAQSGASPPFPIELSASAGNQHSIPAKTGCPFPALRRHKGSIRE